MLPKTLQGCRFIPALSGTDILVLRDEEVLIEVHNIIQETWLPFVALSISFRPKSISLNGIFSSLFPACFRGQRAAGT